MDLSGLAVAGRVILGLVFIYNAIRLFGGRQPASGLLATKGVPNPMFVILAGVAIQVGLGGLVVLGLWMPVAAIGLALFVIAATAMVHDFWRQQGPVRAAEENTVVAHALLVSALLVVAAYPW